jgi:hypothetical protein
MPERYTFTQRYVLQPNFLPNTQWTLATAQRLGRNGTSKNRDSTVTCSTTKIGLLLIHKFFTYSQITTLNLN